MNEAVEGMRVGGVRVAFVPAAIGYGSRRVGDLPPNATIIYDIELLDVVGIDHKGPLVRGHLHLTWRHSCAAQWVG
jgi:hypothetical protein